MDVSDITDCNYHRIFNNLYFRIYERIDHHYDWEFFDYWLGDESNLDRIYKEVFQQVMGNIFNEEQEAFLEKKGRNLQNMIGTWKVKCPSKSCVFSKMQEYISYQLKKKDIVALIGHSC